MTDCHTVLAELVRTIRDNFPEAPEANDNEGLIKYGEFCMALIAAERLLEKD